MINIPIRSYFFLLALFVLLIVCLLAQNSASGFQNNSQLVLTPAADTYVFSGSSTATPPPNWSVLWVGRNDTLNYGDQRALLKFDLMNLPLTATVQSAIFSINLKKAVPPTDPALDIGVYRLKGEWSEMIVWDEYKALQESDESGLIESIGKEPGVANWNVKTLIHDWLADPDRGDYFSVVLRSNILSGDRERTFWSKDCGDECEKKYPMLNISYTTPLPPPTPTPTPIPGVRLGIESNLKGSIENPGDELEYLIHYKNSVPNVLDVRIQDQLPTNMDYVADSANLGGKHDPTTDTITWNIGALNANEVGAILRYKAKRPFPLEQIKIQYEEPVEVETPIAFTAAITPNVEYVSYDWNFGDGELGSGQEIIHTYDELGPHTVVVTATNKANQITSTVTVAVMDHPITGLMVTSDSPTKLGEPTTLRAMIASTSKQITYTWSFGEPNSQPVSQLNSTIKYTYTTVGVFTATVTTTNGSNVTATASTVVTVTNTPDGLIGISDANTVIVPQNVPTVELSAQSQVPLPASTESTSEVNTVAEPQGEEPVDSCEENEIILSTEDEFIVYNSGAVVTWRYTPNGEVYCSRSGSVRNPPLKLYLPLISRNSVNE